MDAFVRIARPDDALAVTTLHVRSWQAAYQGLLPTEVLRNLSIEQRRYMWQGLIASPLSPRDRLLLAESDREVVGFACIGPTRDEEAVLGLQVERKEEFMNMVRRKTRNVVHVSPQVQVLLHGLEERRLFSRRVLAQLHEVHSQ